MRETPEDSIIGCFSMIENVLSMDMLSAIALVGLCYWKFTQSNLREPSLCGFSQRGTVSESRTWGGGRKDLGHGCQDFGPWWS